MIIKLIQRMDTTQFNESVSSVSNVSTHPNLFNDTATLSPETSGKTYVDILQDKMNLVEYIACPTLLVLGLLGNLGVVLTVSHQRFSHMTSRYILCALAFSDSLLLLTNPFNQQFMLDLWGRDVRALSVAGCKFFIVMYRTGKMTASWLIVLVATERFVAVLFPLKVKLLLRKRIVALAICSIYVFILLITGSWTFSTNIKDGRCLPSLADKDKVYLHKRFIIVAATFYSLLPLAFLLILTPPIIVKLVTSQNMRQTMYQGNNTRVSRDTSRVSVMLVGVVCSYVFWVTPITFVLIMRFWSDEPFFSSKRPENVVLTGVALLFEQINHSSNFAIYILFSQQFRQRFLEMIRCCKENPNVTSSTDNKVTPPKPALTSDADFSTVSILPSGTPCYQ